VASAPAKRKNTSPPSQRQQRGIRGTTDSKSSTHSKSSISQSINSATSITNETLSSSSDNNNTITTTTTSTTTNINNTNNMTAATALSSSSMNPPGLLSLLTTGNLGTPTCDHPYNRHGYKYTYAVPSLSLRRLQFRQEFVPPHFQASSNFEQTSLSSSSLSIPSWNRVQLSHCDSNPFLRIDEYGMRVRGDKGYATVRGSVGVKVGKWFYEVKILKGGGDEGACVRLGISRREGNMLCFLFFFFLSFCVFEFKQKKKSLQIHSVFLGALDAPCGYDSYSYSYRDKTGEKVHESLPVSYGPSFKTGDVIGVLVDLPPLSKELDEVYHYSQDVRPDRGHRVVIKYKGVLFWESRDYIPINSPLDFNTSIDESSSTLTSNSTSISSITPDQNLTTSTSESSLPKIEPANSKDMKSELPDTKKDTTTLHDENENKNENMIENKKETKKEKEETDATMTTLRSSSFPIHPDSSLTFYLNGKSLGKAFANLSLAIPASILWSIEQRQRYENAGHPIVPIEDDGSLGWYPAISCFGGGSVQVNFGSLNQENSKKRNELDSNVMDIDSSSSSSSSYGFEYPPNDVEGWKPWEARGGERETAEGIMDILSEVCGKG